MKLALSLSGLTLLLLAGGCEGSPNQVGDTSYALGTLTSLEAGSFVTLRRATLAAMKSLRLRPMQLESDGFSALYGGESVHGPLAQSHELRVWVRRVSDTTTEIEIRIRGRRDEQRLRVILGEIRKKAAEAEAAAGSSTPAPGSPYADLPR